MTREYPWDDGPTKGEKVSAALAESRATREALRAELVDIAPPPKLALSDELRELDSPVRPGLPLSIQAEQQHKLESIRDQLFMETAAVCQDLMKFGDIDIRKNPDDPDGPPEVVVPDEWLDELGSNDLVERRKRLAMMGRMDNKDAPIGAKLAVTLFTGMLKARSNEGKGPSVLNVQVVQMSAPLPQLPEKEIGFE